MNRIIFLLELQVKPKTTRDDTAVRTSSVRNDESSWLQSARNNAIKQHLPPVPKQPNPLVRITGKIGESKQQQYGSMPVPVKPKEQQPLTTHAKVQPMKSVSQQIIPKISQKRTISSDHCGIIRPGMHNQGRHDVPKQLVTVSSNSARKNEKQSWQIKSQTSEKNVLSKIKYSQEFPVSYKVIVHYCVV